MQATIQAHGDIAIDRESEAGWSKVRFNFTAAEARQFAAQLIAATDSHDRLGADGFIMRRLEKIADHRRRRHIWCPARPAADVSLEYKELARYRGI